MNARLDIRWKQRYTNYVKALSQLDRFIAKAHLNELEKQGLIKAFEYTYELAWNVLKDYLEYQGTEVIAGARDTFRGAFRVNLIEDGETWMDMIESRSRTSHTYNEVTAEAIAHDITNRYHPCFRQLADSLADRLTQ